MSEASPPAFAHREAVRAAVLVAASAPQTLAALKKAAKAAVASKKDGKPAEAVVEEMVAAGELHKHGTAKNAPYGRDKPIDPNDPEKVREALLAAAATPQTRTSLVKAAVTATKAGKTFVEEQAAWLIEAERLHRHGTTKTAPYGRDKPADPNDPAKVSAALLEAAAEPQTQAKLVAAAVAATGAAKTFVTEQAKRLVEAERLHKHGAGKAPTYGRDKPKPTHPLDTADGKKAFEKLVAAARKLLESATGLPADDLLDRLRRALTPQQTASPLKAAPPPELGRSEVAPPADVPEAARSVPSPERIRSALKAAYDELCLFPEFEDKLVEIRRLYHAAARLLPGLTVPQLHRELEHLQAHRQVELHALNEVQSAKEPHLALARGDQLLYFAIWR